MVLIMSLAMFMSLASLGWALIPHPNPYLAGGFGAPPAYWPLMEGSTRGKRRLPLFRLLVGLGRLLPRLRRPKEAKGGQLIYTGSRVSVEEFAGLKLLAALGGVLAGMAVVKELGTFHPLVVLVFVAAGLVLPGLWLRSRIAGRRKAIIRVLPEVIDLLALCIGAGLDFLMALTKVVGLKRFQKEPLIEELSAALQEIKFGKRRAEALKTMGRRLNLSELSSFVRTVVQADRMGTPIGEVLAVHAEDVRGERLVKAERLALKAPIKILFPLIFCIMPCVAIIVGAPIFLQFMRQNPFGQ